MLVFVPLNSGNATTIFISILDAYIFYQSSSLLMSKKKTYSEKEMATHSSILAQKIPWKEETW